MEDARYEQSTLLLVLDANISLSLVRLALCLYRPCLYISTFIMIIIPGYGCRLIKDEIPNTIWLT